MQDVLLQLKPTDFEDIVAVTPYTDRDRWPTSLYIYRQKTWEGTGSLSPSDLEPYLE